MTQAVFESTAATRTRKPFHESVVDEILMARTPTHLTTLGTLLIHTKIPKGHASIREAWEMRCKELNCGLNFAGRVLDDIGAQEREVAREAKKRERQQSDSDDGTRCGTLMEVPDERETICQP